MGNRIFSSNCRFHRLDVIWLLVSATVALRFKYQRLSTPHAIVTATRPHYDAQQTAMHVSDTLSSSSACILTVYSRLNFYSHFANAAQAISSELSQPRETPIAGYRQPARCSNAPDQQCSACGYHHNAAITAVGGCRLRICSPIEPGPGCAACIFGSSTGSSTRCCRWRSSVVAMSSISWP